MIVLLAQAVSETIGELRHTADVVRDNLRDGGLKLAGHVLAAALIFLIGRWLAKLIARLSSRLIARTKTDPTAAAFLADAVYVVLLAFVVVSALGWLGFDTTSLAAAIAAAGLAIGLALQGSLSNFASGILLILFKPFRVGDSIEIGTSAGTVEEVHVLSTLLRTADNATITIPNSQLAQGVIKNLSAKDSRRIDLCIHCGYEDDLPAVKSLLEEIVRGDNRILSAPPPTVAVTDFVDVGVQFSVQPWVKTADYGDVKAQLHERIKRAFDEHKFKLHGPKR